MKKSILIFGNSLNSGLSKKSLRINNRRGIHFVMLAMPLPIHAVKGAIDMPTGIAKRVARSKEISGKAARSTWVSISTTRITALNGKIADYETADPANRPNFYRIMINALEDIMFDFQKAANADPGNAIAILQSGGFKVVEVNVPQQQEFAAENGVETGEVILVAAGGGKKAHLHEWKYSSDGINFVLLRSTSKAKKLVQDLPSGSIAYFTHELIIQDIPQGVSQIIKIRVK